ncbi:hypothetical protein CHS0354_036551 [Potamilus streckersoni]|uniref:Uncharacterized protein n=1 Tax=Potamilus streckersoni TaxID=2493646 RepID=A0AAE0SXY6_9BIVA|nr:hypothetical protein CHS0354_036551 [Potamilus streckersoni]
MKGLQNENKENEIQEIREPEEENQSKSDEMIAPSPSKTISSQQNSNGRKEKQIGREKGSKTKGKNDTMEIQVVERDTATFSVLDEPNFEGKQETIDDQNSQNYRRNIEITYI